jgi:hypothetical protein
MKSKTLCDLLAVFCTKISKLVQQAAPRARIHAGMCTNFTAMHLCFYASRNTDMHTITAFNVPLFIQKPIKAKRFNIHTQISSRHHFVHSTEEIQHCSTDLLK